MNTILIRTDAGPHVGIGHVMRCLALSQAWQNAGGRAVFAVTSAAGPLLPRLKSENAEVMMLAADPGSDDDVHATVKLGREKAATWVAMDGYCFGASHQDALRDAGLRLLFLDDSAHAGRYPADIVVNQNICATESMYQNRSPDTRFLLGTRYCLLRREFLARRAAPRSRVETVRNVLVTMGGADPAGITALVLEALDRAHVHGLRVKTLVGPINTTTAAPSCKPVNFGVQFLQDADVVELMNWADVAISAAGITTWELLYMGVPSLLITAAENQKGNAEALDACGAAVHLGEHQHLSLAGLADKIGSVLADPDLRCSLAERGASIVDGRGSERVVASMRSEDLKLRRATVDDAQLLWEWANDAETRAASFSSAPIPWDTHLAWFRERLADPAAFLYVAAEDGEPVGQLRYELEGDQAVVSISIARGRRGRGYGQALLHHGARKLFEESQVQSIHAYVKASNAWSSHAFQRAGFEEVQSTMVHGQDAVLLVRKR